MIHSDYSERSGVAAFMAGVYGWMSCALTLTAASAYYVAITPELFNFFLSSTMMIVLMIGQIALVFGIVFLLPRLTFLSALVMFLLYALSLGISLSALFFVFELGSIVSTFLTTALTFGLMSLYGYLTRSDLTTIGNLSVMILVGLLVGMIINMFLQSEQFDYIISGIGVIVFALLTAYDSQKIKAMYMATEHGMDDMNENVGKLTVIGALTLYLDFINLFLFLLRFMGKKQER